MMKDKNHIIRQISVFIDNRPASLAEMTRSLADRNINLRALSLAETRDFGTTRIIVADVDTCSGVLRDAGYHFIETEVLAVEVADRPGGMADVLECIANEHISVEYAYAMIEKRDGSAVIILRVDNIGKAIMALRKRNIRLLTREDVALL
ncbi:MAG: amino acid-binding protein [Desulfobacterota bacterium]|nr:amino acid-binding protein [Thermodesulfobacteriota bacterium]